MSIADEHKKPTETDEVPTWDTVLKEYEFELCGDSFPYKKEVLFYFQERDSFGRKKWGIPLQPYNGQDPLVEAMQESSDKIAYLRNAYEQSYDEKERLNLWNIYYSELISFENIYMVYRERNKI